ncbi:MAG: VOC family protein [Acidobacteria bacterium]|nr:VOC family protein [Acidobacteriota bacterium]
MKPLFVMALICLAAAHASAELGPFNTSGIAYGHVHLNVAGIELHKKLWVEHFGGVVVTKGPLTTIKFPTMLLVLTQRAPTGSSQETVMDHFGFKVRSLAETLQGWRTAGYEVQREFTGAEGFPNAYLLGPDGVRVELQEDKTLTVKATPNHVHFLTPDFVALLDWYANTFALTKRARGTIATTADAGAINLTFGTAPMPTAPTKGRAIDHIGFEVRNLEAFCRQLEARGITLDVPYREIPSLALKIAFLTDPNGTYIELTEGFDRY